MVMSQIKNYTDKELQEDIKEVLETWPLYRKLEYLSGDQTHVLPTTIYIYCDSPRCKKKQFWATFIQTSAAGIPTENHKTGFRTQTYTCKNCSMSQVNYLYFWQKKHDEPGYFFKAGQYPPIEEEIADALSSAFDKHNLVFYKTAVRLRNFNLGIGALGYLRRIVENHMNDMLDILHILAVDSNASPDVLAKLKDIKASHRFSEKIEYGEALLPKRLNPEGRRNPIGALHDLASEGLHSKSDDECVEIFDRCRKVFDFVFCNLKAEQEAGRRFVLDLDALSSKKDPTAQKSDPI